MSTSNPDFDAQAATDYDAFDVESVARMAQELYREGFVGATEPVTSQPIPSTWGVDPVSPAGVTQDSFLASLPDDLGPLLTLVDPSLKIGQESTDASVDTVSADSVANDASVDDVSVNDVSVNDPVSADNDKLPQSSFGTTTSTDADAQSVDASVADLSAVTNGIETSPSSASIDELVELGRKLWDQAAAHSQSLTTPPSDENIRHSLENYPRSFDDAIELAADDHPFLTGKAEGTIDAARDLLKSFEGKDSGVASIGPVETGLDHLVHDFSFSEHLDTGLVSDSDYGVAGIAAAPATSDAIDDQPGVAIEGVEGAQAAADRSGEATPGDAQVHDTESAPQPEDGFSPSLVPALQIEPEGFNAERLREDFPILREKVHGQRIAWLDNGATTQKPQCVIDRISYFYEHENSNVHRTAHTLAGRATDAYEGARDKIRKFINARSSDEIVYVRGATEGMNLLANTFGEQNVGEGDEILISWLEHHANIVPWQMLCQRKGAKLKVAPVDDSGQIILSEYERLITPRTKLISFTQVSNALGTITPAAEMIEIAHRHGVPVILDGAQGVLHMKVDVQTLDPDFYVFSGHKMFGPTGIGVVYGKKEHLDKMPPWQGGGNMIDCVQFDRTTYQDPPWRFEAGTGNIADAVGLGAAVDYVSKVGLHNIAAHEHELLEYGTAGLLKIPGLRLIGTAQNKAAVMSFDLAGHKAEDVGAYLDQQGIAVRAGHHCAQPILRRFGVTATVRPSLALYNTHEDLDRLFEALHRLQSGGA